MRTATCSACGAVYDADSVDAVVRDEPGHPCMDPYEDVLDLCPGDEVPAGRCTAKIEGEEFPCGMSCYLDDDHARAPISAPGSTVEDLENDLAALDVSLALADLGARVMRGELDGTLEEAETLRRWISRLYQDGAGSREPDAVVAWLKERIAETENTIDALAGAGPPLARRPEGPTNAEHAEVASGPGTHESGSRKGS